MGQLVASVYSNSWHICTIVWFPRWNMFNKISKHSQTWPYIYIFFDPSRCKLLLKEGECPELLLKWPIHPNLWDLSNPPKPNSAANFLGVRSFLVQKILLCKFTKKRMATGKPSIKRFKMASSSPFFWGRVKIQQQQQQQQKSVKTADKKKHQNWDPCTWNWSVGP